MAKELLIRNIHYEHFEKLGGKRKEITTPLGYDNGGWQNKSFRSCANYMLTKSFIEGIEKITFVNYKI